MRARHHLDNLSLRPDHIVLGPDPGVAGPDRAVHGGSDADESELPDDDVRVHAGGDDVRDKLRADLFVPGCSGRRSRHRRLDHLHAGLDGGPVLNQDHDDRDDD